MYLSVKKKFIATIIIVALFSIVCTIIEKRRVFDIFGLKVRRNVLSLILFTLCYSIILSPVCLFGYFQEFFKLKKTWK